MANVKKILDLPAAEEVQATIEHTAAEAAVPLKAMQESVRTLTEKSLEQARSQYASARKTADISNTRYRAGLVSYLEVVESERTALTAERESARITGQRLVTSVQLIKALGGGWGDSVVPQLAANRR